VSRKRNENAVCGNCPYWKESYKGSIAGECKIRASGGGWRDNDDWCGEHPNFFTEEPTP
jgi:hypothetical protein